MFAVNNLIIVIGELTKTIRDSNLRANVSCPFFTAKSQAVCFWLLVLNIGAPPCESIKSTQDCKPEAAAR